MKLRINYESPIPPEELASEMEAAAQPSVGYYLMLGLSAALATFGLISDSAAVIIGAMIIAPLMNPIIACAYSFARGRKDMWMISSFTIVTGIMLVLLVSSAITITVNYQLKGQEILSRGNPSLIDLGIAVVSGIAGAVAWSRRKIGNALPGVAISIALVPPLCVAGIGLTLGEAAPFDPSRTHHYEVYNIELGAMLLFLTNFAAILICGNLVFLIQGYGRWQGAKLGLISSLALVALLSIPLAISFREILFRSAVVEELRVLKDEFPLWEEAQLNDLHIDFGGDEKVISLRVDAAPGAIGKEDVRAMEEAFGKRFGESVKVRVLRVRFDIISSD